MVNYDIILSAIGIIGTILTIVSAIVLWYINEKNKLSEEEAKRKHELYERKEERYTKLMLNVGSFDSLDIEKQVEFMNQTTLCWLYCPDEVIRKTNNFVNAIKDHKDPEKKLGELILAIRTDLIKNKPLKRTNLTHNEFNLLIPRKRDDN